MVDELRAALGDPRFLADEIAVERALIAAVDRDPGLVARALRRSDSTFGRDDADRYLVDRIVDVGEIERLSNRNFAEDKSLVLRSADVADGVWTTTEMLAMRRRSRTTRVRSPTSQTVGFRPNAGPRPSRRWEGCFS
jgi:hypothetical protein